MIFTHRVEASRHFTLPDRSIDYTSFVEAQAGALRLSAQGFVCRVYPIDDPTPSIYEGLQGPQLALAMMQDKAADKAAERFKS